GRSSGCFARGFVTQHQVSTTPPGPTSTNSDRASLVSGSYSAGGTRTRPSFARVPSIRCSFRPAKKRPSTGPVDRRYGYSRTCCARRAPDSFPASWGELDIAIPPGGRLSSTGSRRRKTRGVAALASDPSLRRETRFDSAERRDRLDAAQSIVCARRGNERDQAVDA